MKTSSSHTDGETEFQSKCTIPTSHVYDNGQINYQNLKYADSTRPSGSLYISHLAISVQQRLQSCSESGGKKQLIEIIFIALTLSEKAIKRNLEKNLSTGTSR